MIVFGRNVFNEIINSNKKILKVYLQNDFKDKGILEKIDNNNIEVIKMNKKQMNNKFVGNHQGIALEIEDYNYYKLDDILNEETVVLLDHLEDPHNLGAIIRTCEAAGIKSIIIPKKRSVDINYTVMKVSAGALNNVKIVETSNIVNAMEKLKKNNYWIYSADMKGTKYTEVDYSGKTAIVVGAEGNGVSRLVKEKSDFLISIPMVGKINSLNASVAAAIVIYEVFRQKNR
jgi:23S rRNA (guanosine2251-2'-O)-methyltransferase